jgi:DNA-binding NtrC family response regulator
MSIPPLRERRGDIPVLIEHFLKLYARENGKEIQGVSREARDLLLKYDYPGNVRELENIIQRAVVIARGDVISTEDLPFSARMIVGDGKGRGGHPMKDSLEVLEHRMIAEALQEAHNNQTRAAELLGISERMLRYKLKKYGFKH